MSASEGSTPEAWSAPPFAVYNQGLTYNKAYAKFVDQLAAASQWGVNLVEGKQSIGMIANRVMQLVRFTRKLNRFDFPGAASELKKGLEPPKGLKPGAKYFANNWLEYHFGWEPLIKDIGAAIETIQQPHPEPLYILAKAHSNEQWKIDDGAVFWSRNRYSYDTWCRIAAWVTVENPNLFLANQLGFVNPLSVAWELVPFSFVVDWFANVGQVLNSLTDFYGLTISGDYHSTKQVADLTQQNKSYDTFQQRDIVRTTEWKSVYVTRQLGIPGPTLTVKPFKGLSPTRGLTAISLLLQQMR